MKTLHLQILTPRKAVVDDQVREVTVPSVEGELSILPEHTRLVTMLKEGVITIKKEAAEDYLAIGGGYLETDGKELKILVSRAYRQDEIDEQQTKKALDEAKKMMTEKGDEESRQEAVTTMRRSLVDLKLLRKRRKHSI